MKRLIVAALLALSPQLWSQQPKMPESLSTEAHAIFMKHARDAHLAALKLQDDLQLPVADERVLLHLPKRGFPYLAALVDSNVFLTWAESTLLQPEKKLDSGRHEEAVAGEILGVAMVNRVLANRLASFDLVKQLAPTPEAMKFEQQAKDIWKSLSDGNPFSSEVEFLQSLDSIRALFDQLENLPKLTPEQFVAERAESAVLAPKEYKDERRKWPDRPLYWHRNWNHHGYILAFSESLGPEDYLRLEMVVNERGGIFEWNQPYSGSHFRPDSYESKLPEADLHTLQDFLPKMPASNATGARSHFVVSFLKDGRWITRTYSTLPAGSPFEGLLKRMRYHSHEDGDEHPPVEGELLPPLPPEQ